MRRAATKTRESNSAFHPDAAGDFEFACACKVHAVDEDGNEIALDPEQASLLTLGEEARDVELVRGRDPFSATVTRTSKKSPALPLTCVVKGSASFPTIIVKAHPGRRREARLYYIEHVAPLLINSLKQDTLDTFNIQEVKFNQESSPDFTATAEVSL